MDGEAVGKSREKNDLRNVRNRWGGRPSLKV